MSLGIRLVTIGAVLLTSFQNASGFKVHLKANETSDDNLTTPNPLNSTIDDYKNSFIIESPKNDEYYHNLNVSYEESDVEVSPDTENYNDAEWSLDKILRNSDDDDNQNFTFGKKGDSSKNFNEEIKPEISSNFSVYATTTYIPYERIVTPSTSEEAKGSIHQNLIQKPKELATPAIKIGIINYNLTTLPKCPHGFTLSENKHHASICYLITEPAPFPPTCPYPYTIEYQYIKQNFDITNQTVWAFARRNVSEGFGRFTWLKPIFQSYAEDFTRYVRNYNDVTENITTKNCLAYIKSKLTPVHCSDEYSSLCIYSYADSFPSADDYCKRRFNDSCISGMLGSVTKCYCKSVTSLQIKQPITTFCEKLAELSEPYQNILLINRFSGLDPCWVGLHKEDIGSYRWYSTNKPLTYTFWANNTDFTKTYGALGHNGWVLAEDGDLTCAICEVQIKNHPLVEIHLKRNKSTDLIDVHVTNKIEAFESIICSGDNSKFINLPSEQNISVKSNDICNNNNYCYCTVLQMPDLTTVYSNTIFFINTNQHGRLYAIRVTVPERSDPFLNGAASKACSEIKSELIESAKPIKIIQFNEKEGTIEVLCHLSVVTNYSSAAEEFQALTNIINESNAKITGLASVVTCLPSNTTSGNTILHWPETPVGGRTIPNELCLQVDGSPVTRTCSGGFDYGCIWLPVEGECADVTFSPRTYLLNELLTEEVPLDNLSESLLNVTMDNDNFTSFQVHLVSMVLEKVADYSISLSVANVTAIVNNIMHFESNNLKSSQELLNSTDMILCSLDDILAHAKPDDNGYTSAITDKLVVQITGLDQSDIVGIKLGNSESQLGFDPVQIDPLRQGVSIDRLVEEDLDLAMIIPPQLYNEIISCAGSSASPKVIASVFYDDVLFSEPGNETGHCDGRIISITIPGFNCSFSEPLQVMFKSPINSTDLKCSSWVYGSNDMESIHGHWSIEGDPKPLHNSTYQLCLFTHVTHFSLLVMGGRHNISEGHQKALDIITAVGSGLSLLGLIVVFITAIMFKTYRSANIVLIHFSIAMTAQTILLFIADNVANNKALCTFFGAALHYIVLSQFCWMLTIAVLQYKRYVLIFTSPTTHLVAKACAFAWGLPLVPIVVIISISRDNYGENAFGLCYALGNYFVFGVLVPVSLILFINLIIFLRIMMNIASSRKIKVHRKNDDNSVLHLRLAVMLYFLLGLTWGFGLLAAIGGGVVYSYLFCLTATLQGFILFLFFIVLNDKTRHLWINMTACCRSKSKRYNVNTDSADTAMIRRNRSTKTSDTRTDSTNSDLLRRYKNRRSSDF